MTRQRQLGICLISIVLSFSVAQASDLETFAARQRTAEATKQEAAVNAARLGVKPLAACTPKPISIPTTIFSSLSTASCYDAVINGYEDIYTLNGTAGQTITVDYSSTSYEVFAWFEGLVLHADGTIQSTPLSSGTSRDHFTYTFTQTRSYTLEVESLWGPGSGHSYTGNYTLVITTGGGPTTSCTPTSTTMCLNNDRFAVSATWRTTGGSTGNGTAVRLTADTGYFTFFSATNVEVVVKVLDACGLNSKYWIFAGGLTDVNVTLTVRDTKTGNTKTYTNPLGVAFQPIQDTSALGVCP
jgi:hypothetical protein